MRNLYDDLTTDELLEHIIENDQDQEQAILEYLMREDHDIEVLKNLKFQPKDWKEWVTRAKDAGVGNAKIVAVTGKSLSSVEHVRSSATVAGKQTNRTPEPEQSSTEEETPPPTTTRTRTRTTSTPATKLIREANTLNERLKKFGEKYDKLIYQQENHNGLPNDVYAALAELRDELRRAFLMVNQVVDTTDYLRENE